MENIKKLLICNRGEIAVRIIKTAKELGIETVSIYTAADVASLHVSQADEAVLLPGPDAAAYTDGDGILKIAKEHHIDAVIPGYGFLSQNADFARAVGAAGLVWVGPAPETIEAFSVKNAHDLAKKAGIPIVADTKDLEESRHIEVQVFGNGQGQAINFGERECSIQRRHQKVIEEAPSPFVTSRSGLREKLCKAAVDLAESVKYGSAGSVEYLVDDKTGEFFFLGMKTRLQAEHGITELCYDIDLVELMLKQADAQLSGKGGLSADELKSLQPSKSRGVAIEARVYAENAARDYAPSSGLLQKVEWEMLENARIDTWVFTGCTIPSHYDSLIAKVMIHARTRVAAIKGMDLLLARSTICGPPTNLELLAAIMQDETFKSDHTTTSFLNNFKFAPNAIDVISPGTITMIQDLPGRPTVGRDMPHSGAIDPVALSIANLLVSNERGKEALEIAYEGPELRFLSPAVVALTGADVEASLDGDALPMWTRKHIKAGQILKIGETTGGGCRSYLAVHGGFSGVAEYFGSKSTIGASGGRALLSGDLLEISAKGTEKLSGHPSIPEHLRPKYETHWEVMTMPGPHEDGHYTAEDIEKLYGTQWEVSHNAERFAIQLIRPGSEPVPRYDTAHGSKFVIEYSCPRGSTSITDEGPCILPVDSPNLGGYTSATTIGRADWWKMGQMKAGDTVQFKRVSLAQALTLRIKENDFLDAIAKAIDSGDFANVRPLDAKVSPIGDHGKAILWEKAAEGTQPRVSYRQAGDDHLIIEYGEHAQEPTLTHHQRITALKTLLHAKSSPQWLKDALLTTTSGLTSLTLSYNCLLLPRAQLLSHLQTLELQLGDLSNSKKIPCRKFKLPVSLALAKRPGHDPALAPTQALLASSGFVVTTTGITTVALPVHPTKHHTSPYQISITDGGSIGRGTWLLGQTMPTFDAFGWKQAFAPERPWMFQEGDVLVFEEASEEEMQRLLMVFESGRYEWRVEEGEFDMGAY